MGNDGKERNDLKRKLGYRQVAHKKSETGFCFQEYSSNSRSKYIWNISFLVFINCCKLKTFAMVQSARYFFMRIFAKFSGVIFEKIQSNLILCL